MTELSQDAPPRAWIRTVFWLVLLGAALAWYAIFRVALPLQGEPLAGGALHGNDFKHLYLGAWMLARGEPPFDNPYDARAIKELASKRGFGTVNPYVYLPFTGLVLSPLTLLEPPAALELWFWLNHAFLIAALALTFWSLELKITPPNLVFAVAAAALCFPFHRTMTAGQLNCALLFLFALVYALEKRGRPIAAGAAAAFAFLFKLMPGILLVYFLWNAVRVPRGKERRAFLTAAASMLVFSAVFMAGAVLWVGIDRHLAFLPLLKEMGYGKSTWAEFGECFYRHPANQSFNSLFHHLFAPWDGFRPWAALGADWANGLTRAALAACAALVAWRTWPVQKVPGGPSAERFPSSMTYALFILLGLLAPSIYWDHYAVIALWPLFACWARLPEDARPWLLGIMALLAALLGGFLEITAAGILSLLLAAVVFGAFLLGRCRRGDAIFGLFWAISGAFLLARFVFDLPAFRHGAGLLAMSLKLWGTLILFGLCLAHGKKEPRIAQMTQMEERGKT